MRKLPKYFLFCFLSYLCFSPLFSSLTKTASSGASESSVGAKEGWKLPSPRRRSAILPYFQTASSTQCAEEVVAIGRELERNSHALGSDAIFRAGDLRSFLNSTAMRDFVSGNDCDVYDAPDSFSQLFANGAVKFCVPVIELDLSSQDRDSAKNLEACLSFLGGLRIKAVFLENENKSPQDVNDPARIVLFLAGLASTQHHDLGVAKTWAMRLLEIDPMNTVGRAELASITHAQAVSDRSVEDIREFEKALNAALSLPRALDHAEEFKLKAELAVLREDWAQLARLSSSARNVIDASYYQAWATLKERNPAGFSPQDIRIAAPRLLLESEKGLIQPIYIGDWHQWLRIPPVNLFNDSSR